MIDITEEFQLGLFYFALKEVSPLHITNLSDVTALIAIASFVGGIAMYLFKKIVIEPLQNSIDQLNRTIEGLKETTEKRMEKIEGRLDKVEDITIEHTQQIKTLFINYERGDKNVSAH